MTAHDERGRAIALLEATHRFPCDYPIAIVTVNEVMVVRTVRAAVEEGLTGPLPESACESVPSRRGTYVSLRFQVPCRDAEAVLALHARVKGLKGVLHVI